MKSFRKHNKKIMIIAGSLIMIGFLLTGTVGTLMKNRQQNRNVDIINYIDADGKEGTITSGDLQFTSNILDALGNLGLTRLNMYIMQQSMSRQMNFVLEGIPQPICINAGSNNFKR